MTTADVPDWSSLTYAVPIPLPYLPSGQANPSFNEIFNPSNVVVGDDMLVVVAAGGAAPAGTIISGSTLTDGPGNVYTLLAEFISQGVGQELYLALYRMVGGAQGPALVNATILTTGPGVVTDQMIAVAFIPVVNGGLYSSAVTGSTDAHDAPIQNVRVPFTGALLFLAANAIGGAAPTVADPAGWTLLSTLTTTNTEFMLLKVWAQMNANAPPLVANLNNTAAASRLMASAQCVVVT